MVLTPIAIQFALAVLSSGMVLTVVRLLQGPTLADRVVALDLIATQTIGFIVVYSIASDQELYLRAAIVLALIAFLGTVAFARYMERKSTP